MSVHYDDVRGHFRMDLANERPDCLQGGARSGGHVVGADLSGCLQLDCQGAWLDADEAREVAAALLWWADRQPLTERDVEDVDLLGLLEEGAS